MNYSQLKIEIGNGYGYFCDLENPIQTQDYMYKNRNYKQTTLINTIKEEETNHDKTIINIAICACSIITFTAMFYVWKL